MKHFTLHKQERICSRRLVEVLFNRESSQSMTAFPLRVVYRFLDTDEPQDTPVQILISVPKRCLNRAVKRNRVKRQVREAYRKNKHALLDAVGARKNRLLLIAFLWIDSSLHPSAHVEAKVSRLLTRLAEKASQKDWEGAK